MLTKKYISVKIKGKIVMKIKKIATIALTSILLCGVVTTTAMAEYTEKAASNNTVIRKNESSVTTTNAGAGCSVTRNRTATNMYYNHLAYMKTDKDNNQKISEIENRVYQEGK